MRIGCGAYCTHSPAAGAASSARASPGAHHAATTIAKAKNQAFIRSLSIALLQEKLGVMMGAKA